MYNNNVEMNRIGVVRNITLTNVSFYCTVSKRTLLQRRMMGADPPDVMFVEFFCEKYLSAMDKYIMVILACPHWVQIKHLMSN